MLVTERDPSLKYPRAIKEEKTIMVLDWLLEFRFSSIDILAQRLGSNSVNLNRFFNALIKDGVIQQFQNVHTKNHRYVMLRKAGLAYLEVAGRDISRATTRVQNLGRYSQITHDIAVQKAVIHRLPSIKEVIWDRHIKLPDGNDHPDALLLLKKSNQWVALEYERWRKDRKRIFMTFYNHAQALIAQHYNGVYFIFDKPIDQQFYEKLFEEPEWPRYQRVKKSGVIEPMKTTFLPDSHQNLRKCYGFRTEPVQN